MSARAELARRVLQMLALGESLSTLDALQLRNWALTPKDTMLPLEEIALRILIEEKRNAALSLNRLWMLEELIGGRANDRTRTEP
jgi:hypothetical protein